MIYPPTGPCGPCSRERLVRCWARRGCLSDFPHKYPAVQEENPCLLSQRHAQAFRCKFLVKRKEHFFYAKQLKLKLTSPQALFSSASEEMSQLSWNRRGTPRLPSSAGLCSPVSSRSFPSHGPWRDTLLSASSSTAKGPQGTAPGGDSPGQPRHGQGQACLCDPGTSPRRRPNCQCN